MTNRNLAKRNAARPFNKKDGGRHRHRFVRITGFWGRENFTPTAPQKWFYTWRGVINCPVFEVIEGDQIVATLEGNEEIVMAFGSHTEAKNWIDGKILELMQLQADEADPGRPDFIPFTGEPMGQTIIAEGQEIGPEINF